MRKNLLKGKHQTRESLKLNKETLRLLEANELGSVEGAGSATVCPGGLTTCPLN